MKMEIRPARQRLLDVVPLAAPFTIFLDPCGRCNLKCVFCPCNNSTYKAKNRHTMMSFELFEKIAAEMASFEVMPKVVNLYGFGEPLLNPSLPDMIKLLKNKICCEVLVTTNGVLLTPELNRKLVDSGVDAVRVSVNAVSEEAYCRITGVQVDYEKFLRNIENLYEYSRGSGTRVCAKIIAADLDCQAKIDEALATYRDISDNYFIEAQEERWAAFNVATRTVDNARRQAFAEYDDFDAFAPCSYPLTHLTIFSSGEVGVCCVDWRKETVIGDVRGTPLKEIWGGGGGLHDFRVKMLTGGRAALGACRECKLISPDDICSDAAAILKKLEERRTF
jgi:MoaA/NifB/PqqE/SkfB family radical SAM enzyme